MSVAAPATTAGPRVKPSIGAGLFLFAGYLAIFYTTWKINDVDYPSIGDTVESAKLHYALPTLFGGAFLVVALTVMGWWRITLFDSSRGGPKWAWIGPIGLVLLAIAGYASLETDNTTTEMVLWCVLGAIGVGFGEEMITRGGLLVGLRTKYAEGKVALLTALAFSLLHAPNALFGQSVKDTFSQLILAFLLGLMFWGVRRLSGTLILPMILHGLWDSSIFLPKVSGADPVKIQSFLGIFALVTVIGMYRSQKNEHVISG